MGFFDSSTSNLADAGYDIYLQQINTIRNSLLGVSSSGPHFDKQTQQYFLKVKELGALYIGLEFAQSALQKSKLNAYYKDLQLYHDRLIQQTGLSPNTLTEATTNPDFDTQNNVPSIPVPKAITTLYTTNSATESKATTFFKDNNLNTWKSAALPAGSDIFPNAG